MYWTERQKQLNRELETSERKLRRRLYRTYKAEALRLANEIDAYYAKYGVDNVLKYRVLMQRLDESERMLLFQNVEAFRRMHPEVNLEVSFSAYKINRLEALQTSVLMQAAELGLAEQAAVKTHMENMAALGANAVNDTIGRPFFSERADIIQRVVNKKWSRGENFSDRIWSNRQRLARDVNTRLAQGFARGDSRAKLVRDMSKRFTDVSKANIDRLVYTEGTYVMNEAQAATFEDAGFSYYKVSPIGDTKTCPYCNDIAGETEMFPVLFKDREPGVNFPPLHPYCRCTFDIVIPDRMAFMAGYTGGNSEDILDEFYEG